MAAPVEEKKRVAPSPVVTPKKAASCKRAVVYHKSWEQLEKEIKEREKNMASLLSEIESKLVTYVANIVYAYAVDVGPKDQFIEACYAQDLVWIDRIENIYHLVQTSDTNQYKQLLRTACRPVGASPKIVLWVIDNKKKFWGSSEGMEKALVGGIEEGSSPPEWDFGYCRDNAGLRQRLLQHFLQVEIDDPSYVVGAEDIHERYDVESAFLVAAEKGYVNTLRWCMRLEKEEPTRIHLDYSAALNRTIKDHCHIPNGRVRAFKLISLHYKPLEKLGDKINEIKTLDKQHREAAEYRRGCEDMRDAYPWLNALRVLSNPASINIQSLRNGFRSVAESICRSDWDPWSVSKTFGPEDVVAYREAVCYTTRKNLEFDLKHGEFEKHYSTLFDTLANHLIVFREMGRRGCARINAAFAEHLGITFTPAKEDQS
jgi:hypothetical protein